MRVAILGGLAFVAAAQHYAELWADFKAKHGGFTTVRGYDTHSRFEIFKSNVDFIHTENQKNHTFELAINKFADLSNEEFRSIYLGLQKREKPHHLGAYLGEHTWDGSALPDSIDWVDLGAVTPVKDQKSCGSCWAFSAIGALEGAAKLKNGVLKQMSEQQLVDCSKENDGCNGGLMDDAFQYAMTAAICSEESYPYLAQDGASCRKHCNVVLEAGALSGYTDVGHTDDDLMSALAKQPVSVAIEADHKLFQFYSKGVFSSLCGATLDHGVLAVGYGTWTDGKPYYKIKNSWSEKWGMSGYILLKRGTKPWKRTGECGILKSASYPRMLGSLVV